MFGFLFGNLVFDSVVCCFISVGFFEILCMFVFMIGWLRRIVFFIKSVFVI